MHFRSFLRLEGASSFVSLGLVIIGLTVNNFTVTTNASQYVFVSIRFYLCSFQQTSCQIIGFEPQLRGWCPIPIWEILDFVNSAKIYFVHIILKVNERSFAPDTRPFSRVYWVPLVLADQ